MDEQKVSCACADGQYTQLVRDILRNGQKRKDRTGTGTLSVFGRQMRFDLSDHKLPLLTTKKVFFRGVLEELLWIISGSTDAKALDKKGITFWNGNGSREFLDNRGLSSYREGDLGPVYGFQWRHFGAEYKGADASYDGQGKDQLQHVIEQIMSSSMEDRRRIILSAWNPTDLDKMALPPCHMMCQFYVDDKKRTLSCHLYQRSGDMGLGVPFNIASYSLLTHMIANTCGLTAAEFVHTIGDAHIYLDHVEPLQKQISRKPKATPTIEIKKPKGTGIDEYVYEDFLLRGYKPHPTIRMKMSV